MATKKGYNAPKSAKGVEKQPWMRGQVKKAQAKKKGR